MVKILLFDRPVNSIHTHCRKGAVVTAVSCGVQKKTFLASPHAYLFGKNNNTSGDKLEKNTNVCLKRFKYLFRCSKVHLSSLFIVPICKSSLGVLKP